MSNIEVSGKIQKKYKDLAKNVASQVIDFMKQPDVLEVAIEFVSEKEIQRLNREVRGIDKVTDVLSFPATNLSVGEILDEFGEDVLFLKTEDGNIHFGDMAICFAQTERQAKEYGVSVESEIKKLVIHSMLHLMGYDHIEDSDYEIMNPKEIELDKLIKI